MTYTYYESVNGGVNNLIVACDAETGDRSGSFLSKEHAHKALRRKLARKQMNLKYRSN